MTNPRPFDAAGHLRTQFDRTFTLPPADRATGHRDFVVIEVAGHAFAVPTASLSSVQRVAMLVPVPSTAAALLGIVGVRSAIIPVFSLRTLLDRALRSDGEAVAGPSQGEETRAAAETWIALCEFEGDFAGFAFDRVLTYRRVAPTDVFARQEGGGSAPGAASAAEAIRLGQDLCPVLDISALMRQILAAISGSGGGEAYVTAQVTPIFQEIQVPQNQEANP